MDARFDNNAECLGDIRPAATPPEEPRNSRRKFILSDRSCISYEQVYGLRKFDLRNLDNIAVRLEIASGYPDRFWPTTFDREETSFVSEHGPDPTEPLDRQVKGCPNPCACPLNAPGLADAA